jgi:hypothetical protein
MMMNIITNLTPPVYVSSPNQLYATGRTYLKREAFDSWVRVRSRNMSQCTNVYYLLLLLLLSLALQPSAVWLWPPHSRGFLISHNDAPQSVEPLWTSDELVAETSTWQHTTHTTDKHPWTGGVRTHNRRMRVAVDLRLRQLGHWDRHSIYVGNKYIDNMAGKIRKGPNKWILIPRKHESGHNSGNA